MEKNEQRKETDDNMEEETTKQVNFWVTAKKIILSRPSKITLFICMNGLLIYLIIYLFMRYNLFKEVKKISITTLVIYITIFLVLILIKSARYLLLLINKLGFSRSFIGVSLGFFINSLVPGRIGDVSRFVYLKNTKPEITAGEYIGTLIAEKVLDLVSLLTITIIFILVSAIQVFSSILWILLVAGIIFILVGVGIFLIIKYHRFFDKILTKFIARFSEKADVEVKLSESIYNYFSTLFKSKIKIISNVFLSFTIVIIDSLLIYLILHELLTLLPIYLGILTGAIGFLAVVFPILPGGLGSYQGSMVLTLSVFSFSETLTLAASTIEFALRTTIYIIIGLPIYLVILYQARRKRRAQSEVSAT